MKGTFVYVAGGFNEHTDNPILLLIALSRQRTNMIVDVPMYSYIEINTYMHFHVGVEIGPRQERLCIIYWLASC
jgi:hypothetical protein